MGKSIIQEGIYWNDLTGEQFESEQSYFDYLWEGYIMAKNKSRSLLTINRYLTNLINKEYPKKKLSYWVKKFYQRDSISEDKEERMLSTIEQKVEQKLKENPISQVIVQHKQKIIGEAVEETNAVLGLKGKFFREWSLNKAQQFYDKDYIQSMGDLGEMVLTEDLMNKIHDPIYMETRSPAEQKMLFEMVRALRGQSFQQTSAVDLQKQKENLGETGRTLTQIVVNIAPENGYNSFRKKK